MTHVVLFDHDAASNAEVAIKPRVPEAAAVALHANREVARLVQL